jgi:serine/threonine protein phosphatase PrpC
MNLSESDKFIVIASDGVWEFLSNDEVVRIVEPFYH